MQVIVIGGGPAGMMAAGIASDMGHKVYLTEKNEKLGKKLRITGKGRCNLTNACTYEELLSNVVSNPRFLYSAFRQFSNTELMEFMENLGVPLKVERGNRVFPQSDSALDVIYALKNWLRDMGVSTIQAKADDLVIQDGRVCGVRYGEKAVRADAVILATGGMSYPQTGSDGDGYKMAQRCGHTIVSPKPSLVPLVTKEQYNLSGVSLKNIQVSVFRDGDLIYREFGEMLFTHYGISGPVVLSASAHMQPPGEYRCEIDFKPALTDEILDKRLLRDFEKFAKKDFIHAFDDLLPKRVIETVVIKTGIDPHKKAGTLSKEERRTVLDTLKHFSLTITGFRPIAEAIVTSGGVKTNEINPKTMESKLIKGLYFAGEILDVDAYTGGFNLQIAFSTGYAAGKAVGERVDAE